MDLSPDAIAAVIRAMQPAFVEQKTYIAQEIKRSTDAVKSELSGLVASVATLTTRVGRTEKYLSKQDADARNNFLAGNQRGYERDTADIFNKSALFLSPPGRGRKNQPDGASSSSSPPPSASSGSATTANPRPTSPPARHDRDAIIATMDELAGPGKYQVETTRVGGFRLVCNARLRQERQHLASHMLKCHREVFQKRFGLTLHYDKPVELRQTRQIAGRFFSFMKKGRKGLVVTAKNGMYSVNDVPIVTEHLVPRDKSGWKYLAQAVHDCVVHSRVPPPDYDGLGVLRQVFEDVFVEAHGPPMTFLASRDPAV